jgi:hypothetical protein
MEKSWFLLTTWISQVNGFYKRSSDPAQHPCRAGCATENRGKRELCGPERPLACGSTNTWFHAASSRSVVLGLCRVCSHTVARLQTHWADAQRRETFFVSRNSLFPRRWVIHGHPWPHLQFFYSSSKFCFSYKISIWVENGSIWSYIIIQMKWKQLNKSDWKDHRIKMRSDSFEYRWKNKNLTSLKLILSFILKSEFMKET